MMHAPETCAPILDTRHIPSRKDSARVSLVRSLIKGMGIGTTEWRIGTTRWQLRAEYVAAVETFRRMPHFHVTSIKCVIKIRLELA